MDVMGTGWSLSMQTQNPQRINVAQQLCALFSFDLNALHVRGDIESTRILSMAINNKL